MKIQRVHVLFLCLIFLSINCSTLLGGAHKSTPSAGEDSQVLEPTQGQEPGSTMESTASDSEALACPSLGGGDLSQVLEENVFITSSGNRNLPNAFNGGRPYAISYNTVIPDAMNLRDELVQRMAERNLLSQVLLDPFGTDSPPEPYEVTIGSKVPIELAQCVIRVYAVDGGLDIVLTASFSDGDLAETQRIYIAGYVDTGGPAASQNLIRSLLRPGISKNEFFNLISNQ